MSSWSLGYLVTRRFYPRKICSQQAEILPGIVSQASSVPAAGGPGRSLHSLRDLSAGENGYGPLVATVLGGGLGILISKKRPDDEDNKPMQVQVTNIEQRDVDMDARFHKWMKLVGRVYPNHEEEIRRFELFKKRVKCVESLHRSSVEYVPNKFADRTDKEIMTGRHGQDSAEYEYEALLRWVQEEMLKHEPSSAVRKAARKQVMQLATDP